MSKLTSRRFWVALVVGTLLGAGVASAFGPWVRGRIDSRAKRVGLAVTVRVILPRFQGLELRGVEVTAMDVAGVKVRLPSVVVPWGTRRPERFDGGRIEIRGDMEERLRALGRWRKKYRGQKRSKDAAAATESGLAFADWALDVQGTLRGTAVSVRAEGAELQRTASRWTVGVAHLRADRGKGSGVAKGLRLVVSRQEGDFRLHELSTTRLDLSAEKDLRGWLAASKGDGLDGKIKDAPGAPAAAKPGSGSPSGKKGPGRPASGSKIAKGETSGRVAVHWRVAAARRWLSQLKRLKEWLRKRLNADAVIALRGATAGVRLGAHRLKLGPGTFALEQKAEGLALQLLPDLLTEQALRAQGKGRPLTFRIEVPAAGADKPLVAELRGGPVRLSALGIRDGFLGLKNVHETVLQSDVTLKLGPTGEDLRVAGNGRIRKLSVASPKLATKALRNLEIAWRGALELRLDGDRFALKQLEFDLGDLRGILNGTVHRKAGAYSVDLAYRVPLVTCQRAFESIPDAMIPLLKGMRLAGSLALRGHARFDMSRLRTRYDVDWQGTLGCRVVQVPPAVDVKRFSKSFEKVVYAPDGSPYTRKFRDEENGWAPLGGISHFMVGAVLTCEDGRFFRHNGFDKEAIVNSLRENLVAGRFVRGASTISMQLAKNLYLSREKTLSRKLQEAILTLYLEQALTKNEMMELYLNVIEYGPKKYGVKAAAKHFFNGSPGGLSLGQAMYLGSILRNPKKQFFAAGGQVSAGRMSYLRRLMKILHKIKRISDDELELGLRETVLFGAPSHVAPVEDDPYSAEEDGELGQPPPSEG